MHRWCMLQQVTTSYNKLQIKLITKTRRKKQNENTKRNKNNQHTKHHSIRHRHSYVRAYDQDLPSL
nr:MAG TPA: hypothetical protein [Caudoviricetes sp.]